MNINKFKFLVDLLFSRNAEGILDLSYVKLPVFTGQFLLDGKVMLLFVLYNFWKEWKILYANVLEEIYYSGWKMFQRNVLVEDRERIY